MYRRPCPSLNILRKLFRTRQNDAAVNCAIMRSSNAFAWNSVPVRTNKARDSNKEPDETLLLRRIKLGILPKDCQIEDQ